MEDVTEVELRQIRGMVQTHHGKIHEIEKTLGQTPDPKTLRHIEHVVDELPSTDDLKDCVKDRIERTALYSRVTWGILATVFGTIALATMSMVWQGIGKALHDVSK